MGSGVAVAVSAGASEGAGEAEAGTAGSVAGGAAGVPVGGEAWTTSPTIMDGRPKAQKAKTSAPLRTSAAFCCQRMGRFFFFPEGLYRVSMLFFPFFLAGRRIRKQ